MMGGTAWAGDAELGAESTPPVATPILPWILPVDGFRLDATAEIEASTAKVAKPFALAPDIWYGATDNLTLGISESRYAMSGFRGSAGASLCLSGTTGGCPFLYNNAGLEAWYATARAPVALVLGGGPYAVNLDRGYYDVKLGMKFRVPAGALAISTMPSVFVAMTGRKAMMTPNTDMLYVPVAFTAKLGAHASIGLGTGVKGPLADVRTQWQVPLGVSATYALGPITIGGAFTFGALVSGATNPPPPMAPVEGADLRVVQIWISYSTFAAPPRRIASPAAPAHRVATRAPRPVEHQPVRQPVHQPVPQRISQPPEPEPEPAPGPQVERISDDTVTAVAANHGGEVAACNAKGELSGDVTITFEINSKGAVTTTALSSSVGDAAVSDCLLGAVRHWQFPEPRSDHARGVYTITYR